ncbi:hypothetical protein BKA82DRAFT_1005135 [Pisolithus tinctorius]|uniref:Uncharacterized protein n=1 Tax=Pisolithus tinctorius Marx 270 TaxID=870435 RepID=A0A0C3NBZ7_PISTI|nr:hypothetical protein BKA82DRAFT_1005135 [Pisolithus tinctorius]KIN98664.1 hypothetical protein M404DRAFT_1005135 [Pisolithus tinctorius Marx 270]
MPRLINQISTASMAPIPSHPTDAQCTSSRSLSTFYHSERRCCARQIPEILAAIRQFSLRPGTFSTSSSHCYSRTWPLYVYHARDVMYGEGGLENGGGKNHRDGTASV